MPAPVTRYKLLPARGTYASLAAALADIAEGEIVYAIDQDQYYQKEGGTLVSVGATKAQGALAVSAVQPGDNVSTLVNDAAYITLADVPANAVQSVNTQTGVVVLDADDIDDTATTNKFATAAQLGLADSSVQPGDNVSTLTNDAGYIQPGDNVSTLTNDAGYIQPGDNVSTLTNDAGYITLAQVPADAVTSVAGKTGVVTLVKADITDFSDAAYATAAQGTLADTAVQPGDLATVATSGSYTDLINQPTIPPAAPVDSVNGQTGVVSLDFGDLADKTITVCDETVFNLTGTALAGTNGPIQYKTLTANTTFTNSMAEGESITLMLDDGASAYTATWPTMTWIGGSAPGLPTTGYAVMVLWVVNGTLYGSYSGDA